MLSSDPPDEGRAMPDSVTTAVVQAAALRRNGEPNAALRMIDPLSRAYATDSTVQMEHGLTLAVLGRDRAAAAAFKRVLAMDRQSGEAWRGLAGALERLGDTVGAEAARQHRMAGGVRDPALMAATAALTDHKPAEAERILRERLAGRPDEPSALRLLAEALARQDRLAEAEDLLRRCLMLEPVSTSARHNLAAMLYRRNKNREALVEAEALTAHDPDHAGYADLHAATLARLGEYERAVAVYARMLTKHPNLPKAWLSYGHALKTLGRQADGVAAYRRALALAPTLGEAWWSLANLKTVRFDDADLAAMTSALETKGLSDDDRLHLLYALGKAHEDAGRWDEAFVGYAAGAAIRRQQLNYDPDQTTRDVARTKAVFTPAFLAARAGQGCLAPDPIFVVGLPRSGSTLVEQILASHSQVEGTMELPDLMAMARRLGGETDDRAVSTYPEALAGLSPDALKALGLEFLERTRIQRKTERPFFVDKMPNNFAHVGLIHLILPNARIIDVRRHPLDCCFSGFKQHFARGQAFSYDLTEIGRYYADYVALMDHFDTMLPGRVHRVFYEALVEDPEREIRAVLDHCRLPFEPACLSPHLNNRTVRTASSEQVRRPISRDGIGRWRKFEEHLLPLKVVLEQVFTDFSAVPDC